jgi:predicted O-methyltransferase YrrM
MSDLPTALQAIAGVEGWLTEAQAADLWHAAAAVEEGGVVVEIGSFRGRSAIVLALGGGPGVAIVCIDPHAGSDRGPQEIAADHARGDADALAFAENLAAAGVEGRVRHVREFSDRALDAVPGPVDLLYVDGAHRFGPARGDLARWGAKVRPGGRMMVHDSFSSVGVTLALLAEVVFSRRWRWQGRTGSLAAWTREAPRRGDRVAQLAQLGWFARNLVLKALIVLRLRRGPWPF